MSEVYASNRAVASRISQTTDSLGTGPVTLSAPLSGYVGFDDVFANGERCYYSIYEGLAWEVGIGTLTSAFLLDRTEVLESSNGGRALNLGIGTKVVQCDVGAHAFEEPEQNIFRSPLTSAALANFLMVNDTGYFVYVGKVGPGRLPAAFIEFQVLVAGAGAQTADVGIFYSVTAPDRTAKDLFTALTTATVDSLTSTGMKRNTSIFATDFVQPIHLFVGVRTAMATTQPTVAGLRADMTDGHVLVKASCGAFASLSNPFSTSLPAIGTVGVAPDLRLTGV